MFALFSLQGQSFHFPFAEPKAIIWPHFSLDGLSG